MIRNRIDVRKCLRVFFTQERNVRTHFRRIEVSFQKISDVSTRVGEQHFMNESDRRRGAFDVEQDRADVHEV